MHYIKCSQLYIPSMDISNNWSSQQKNFFGTQIALHKMYSLTSASFNLYHHFSYLIKSTKRISLVLKLHPLKCSLWPQPHTQIALHKMFSLASALYDLYQHFWYLIKPTKRICLVLKLHSIKCSLWLILTWPLMLDSYDLSRQFQYFWSTPL